MANTIVMNGFFGVKQAFWVSDPDVTTGWYAGQLFKVASIGSSGAGTLKGAPTSRGPFVALNAASGAAIAGVALENSSDASTAVAGMAHPSGSKVTILHGHSSFQVAFGGTATSDVTRQSTGAPWEDEVEDASLMATLYASANGKYCSFISEGPVNGDDIPQPIGYLSQVPAAGNNWTIGVVLFG